MVFHSLLQFIIYSSYHWIQKLWVDRETKTAIEMGPPLPPQSLDHTPCMGMGPPKRGSLSKGIILLGLLALPLMDNLPLSKPYIRLTGDVVIDM